MASIVNKVKKQNRQQYPHVALQLDPYDNSSNLCGWLPMPDVLGVLPALWRIY